MVPLAHQTATAEEAAPVVQMAEMGKQLAHMAQEMAVFMAAALDSLVMAGHRVLVAMVLFALFTPHQVSPAHSHLQTQATYKEESWNCLSESKTVSRLSIQFLATTSAKHFLM
jgi:hypothetical protein